MVIAPGAFGFRPHKRVQLIDCLERRLLCWRAQQDGAQGVFRRRRRSQPDSRSSAPFLVFRPLELTPSHAQIIIYNCAYDLTASAIDVLLTFSRLADPGAAAGIDLDSDLIADSTPSLLITHPLIELTPRAQSLPPLPTSSVSS